MYQCFTVDSLVVGAGDTKPCSFSCLLLSLFSLFIDFLLFGVDVLAIGARDAKPQKTNPLNGNLRLNNNYHIYQHY